jgi:hypothetical protein
MPYLQKKKKKADQLQLSHYEGSTLLNKWYQIFSSILHERLQPHVENIIGKYQCAFRVGKSPIDQIQPMRQFLGGALEY